VAHYRRLVADIRENIPDIALSTDIIVGFPGESEAQFQHTVDLLTEVKFDTVHVACYSPRAGTLASKLPDNVPAGEKNRRLHIIEELQENILTVINNRLLGRTVDVLVEGKTRGKWRGRTRNDKLVFFEAPGDYRGQLIYVRIEKTGPWSLQGILKTVRPKEFMPIKRPWLNKEEK
jgi:tRNA-2-methylthio-N6-dimethylallyladenosine synthase